MGLLNVDGYYNSLLSFIDTAVDEGFIAPSARHIIVSAPTADELMCKLEVVHYSMQHDSSCFMWDKVIGPTNCIVCSISYGTGICARALWWGLQAKLGDGTVTRLYREAGCHPFDDRLCLIIQEPVCRHHELLGPILSLSILCQFLYDLLVLMCTLAIIISYSKNRYFLRMFLLSTTPNNCIYPKNPITQTQ